MLVEVKFAYKNIVDLFVQFEESKLFMSCIYVISLHFSSFKHIFL